MDKFRDVEKYLINALDTPAYLPYSTWIEHIPFAYFLLSCLKPGVFVELGVFKGGSFLNFCQGIKRQSLICKAYGVDTWLGDEHSGKLSYNDFLDIKKQVETNYASFAELLKMSFDEALNHFKDGSIDLLHIDGFHIYEAVKHDYQTWLPKMSSRGVVLFHDIEVKGNNFGVWKLWDELKAQYPHISFRHGHGLGVLFVGEVSKNQRQLIALLDSPSFYSQFFQQVGWHLNEKYKNEERFAIEQTKSDNLTSQLQTEQETTKHLSNRLQAEQIKSEELASKLQTEKARADELAKQLSDEQIKSEEPASMLQTEKARADELAKQLSDEQIKSEELASKLQTEKAKVSELTGQMSNEQMKFNNVATELRLIQSSVSHRIIQKFRNKHQFMAVYRRVKSFLKGVRRITQKKSTPPTIPQNKQALFSKSYGKNDPVSLPFLSVIDAPTLFSVDLINFIEIAGQSQPVYVNERAGSFVVVGWALDAFAKDLAGGVFVNIDGKAYRASYGLNRQDVAQALNSSRYQYSGFRCEIPSRKISAGLHYLSITVSTKDKNAYYHSSHKTAFILLKNKTSFFSSQASRFTDWVIGHLIPRSLLDKLSKFGEFVKWSQWQLRQMFRQPGLFKSKIGIMWSSWRYGGLAAVKVRWERSFRLNFPGSVLVAAKAQEFMRQLLPQLSRQPSIPICQTTKVVVIIPVYQGLAETRHCIESVISGFGDISYEILVINDASPDKELKAYIASLSDRYRRVRTLENSSNMGFVATVNQGMAAAKGADVVLLNSDTVVPRGWLDRLARQAYSRDNIGTVTPFSNNATICSYPDFNGWSTLPDGESVDSIDAAFAEANQMQSVSIPTAIGFCMYIKRACIDDVGYFDDDVFGKGYGEENDFCLRATQNGWEHILAADVFVFHSGEKSFGDSASQKKTAAMKTIRAKYPYYEQIIMEYIAGDLARRFRIAATAARYRQGNKPVVLFVTHSIGGGIEKHIKQLGDQTSQSIRILILRPSKQDDGADLILEAYDKKDSLQINLCSADIWLLTDLIRSFGVVRAHIHHTLGFTFRVDEFLALLGVPYDFTVHDYWSICPRVNLFTRDTGYCGEPSVAECNRCVLQSPVPQGGHSEILWWRALGASMINGAERVICPSHDTARRIMRYFPKASVVEVPHEDINSVSKNMPIVSKSNRSKRRVVILGALAEHKGLSLIEAVARESNKNELPLEFEIIGYTERPLADIPETGGYLDEKLPELIEQFAPDIILFPALWPETYSYTLSVALQSGCFIVATDIGAFSERLLGNPRAKLVPVTISPQELAHLLVSLNLDPKIDVKHEHTITQGLEPNCLASENRIHSYYNSDYLAPLVSEKKSTRVASDHVPMLLVILDLLGSKPSPCSYIRLLIPLMSSVIKNHFRVRFVSFEQAIRSDADVFCVSRTAVPTVSLVGKLLKHCHKIGAKLIYEIDDHLLALPDDHIEQRTYSEKEAAVLRLLIEADQVWVSSSPLKDDFKDICQDIKVFPNQHDLEIFKPISPRTSFDSNVARFLYMGTQTHEGDLAIILDAFKKIADEKKFPFEIHLVGVTRNHLPNHSWIWQIPVPEILTVYPFFMQWLSSLRPFDFGVAPLKDISFNKCKSAIKFFDYTHLGIVTIASAATPYKEVIVHGENGFLAENTTDGWYQSLRNVLANRDELPKVVIEAQKTMQKTSEEFSASMLRAEAVIELLKTKTNVNAGHSRIFHTKILSRGSTFTVTREHIAAALLHGTGVEIGALHNPLRVTKNVNVKYIDRMTKDKLYEHYPELKQYPLVDIDIVDNGETLAALQDESQDFVIANHFIEHSEDTILAFKNFLRVLRKGGIIYCAVPDKTKTFDRNRPVTTLQHIHEDHTQGASRSRKSHFEEWVALVEPNLGRTYASGSIFESRVSELMTQQYSIHFHCWDLKGFKDFLRYLRETLDLPFETCLISEQHDNEFIAVLRKT